MSSGRKECRFRVQKGTLYGRLNLSIHSDSFSPFDSFGILHMGFSCFSKNLTKKYVFPMWRLLRFSIGTCSVAKGLCR